MVERDGNEGYLLHDKSGESKNDDLSQRQQCKRCGCYGDCWYDDDGYLDSCLMRDDGFCDWCR